MEKDYIGKGYRCTDGVVRWVTEQTTRGNYRVLWLEEEEGVWHFGGVWKSAGLAGVVEGAEAFTPPQPGDTYRRAGMFSGFFEVAVPPNTHASLRTR